MSAPTTPTLTVANAGTGTSATATLAGDAGVTHRLFYRKAGAIAWTTGLTRVGNGTIAQTGLTAGSYEFIAVSDNGAYSLPSAPAAVFVKLTATAVSEQVRLALRDRLLELVAEGTLSTVTCPKRYGIETTYRDKEAVLTQQDGMTADPDSGKQGDAGGLAAAGCLGWHRRFMLYFWKRVSQTSAEEIDAALNAAVATISDRLTDPARPFTAPTLYVDIEEDLPVSSNDRSCDGRLIVLHVMFDHIAGNSFLQ